LIRALLALLALLAAAPAQAQLTEPDRRAIQASTATPRATSRCSSGW
jgi:hypothetical protein